MRVYILKGPVSTYVANDLVETEEFYLVPTSNSSLFDVYHKSVFKLSICETKQPEIGFTKGKQ